MSGLVFGLIVLLGAGIIWSFSHSLRRKTFEQETAYAKGLSHKLTRYLSSLPHYRRLPKPFKVELRRKTAVFLAQKKFFGCEGLKITDRMRVIIAAEACLLLLNKKSEYLWKF